MCGPPLEVQSASRGAQGGGGMRDLWDRGEGDKPLYQRGCKLVLMGVGNGGKLGRYPGGRYPGGRYPGGRYPG
eukprot:4638513-Prymnesium_polylepis.1